MSKLRVFETFSGIGAQHKALERQGINYEIVGTSEWDIDAIICYDTIHHGDVKDIDLEFKKYHKLFKDSLLYKKLDGNWDFINMQISDDKHLRVFLNDFMLACSWSRDGKEPLRSLSGITIDKQKRFFIANMRNNNLGSIVDVKGEDIPDFDLLTYSFPCQDLSIASMGRGKGMSQDTESRSALLWQIGRIIDELDQEGNNRLPKYLLLENVTAMLNTNHIKDYKKWVDHLKSYGYDTKEYVLDASKFGIPQPRKRVFAISILNGDNNITKEDIEAVDINEITLKDIIKEGRRFEDELNSATPNLTASRIRMRKENHDLDDPSRLMTRTLTTKQDRNPNAGMLSHTYTGDAKDKANFRFLTPRECFMLMGFDSSDFDRVSVELERGYTRKEKLYQQAGNSIVVNVLQAIFQKIEEDNNGL